MEGSCTARQLAARAALLRGDPMFRRWFPHPVLWSPLVAIAAQLVLATAVAAVTGGPDFPLLR
jgi:hypothetical protein